MIVKSDLHIGHHKIFTLFLVIIFISIETYIVNSDYNGENVGGEDVSNSASGKSIEEGILEKENSEDIFIERDVYDTLESNNKAMVIVWLRGELPDNNIDKIKEKVRENQDIVLRALKNIGDGTNNKDTEEENFKLVYRYEVLNGFAGIINKEGLEILSKNEMIESIYAEKKLYAALLQSVPLIRANQLHQITVNNQSIKGQGQTICVVDTGIEYTHGALGGCFGSGCKVKGGYDFIHNDPDPIDDQGHGTHVAGIVASNFFLLPGVAPNADLIAVKACDNAQPIPYCPGSAMIAGVDYCVANMNMLGTDVITMSIGDGGEYGPTAAPCPTWMEPSLTAAVRLGLPITVSSGNERHTNGIAYPACSQNVISVGATYDANVGSANWSLYGCSDSNAVTDRVTCFSNTASNLDVVAPGAMITSTYLNGGFAGDWGGTSMAAPHVAGTIALLKQFDPSLTPAQVESMLKQAGTPVTNPRNGLIFPRIDAFNTLSFFPNCTIPLNGMVIVNDTMFCEGIFVVPNGITIGIDNINVSCNNTILSGTGIYGSNGILVSSKNNVEIRDCKIQRYAIGINVFSNSVNNSIINNTFYNDSSGISVSTDGVYSPQNNILENNVLFDNNIGIYVQANRNMIIKNKLNNNTNGINLWLSHTLYNTVENNDIYDNQNGIQIGCAFYNTIDWNNIHHNEKGIFVNCFEWLTTPNTYIYNNIYNNSNYSFYHYAANQNQTAEFNWWGTTNCSEIENVIYDFKDNPSLGKIDFEPFLNNPSLWLPDADIYQEQSSC